MSESQALAVRPPIPTAITLTEEKIQLLKRTIARGTTNEELALFVEYVHRTGLDPFTRQIYALKIWDKQLGRPVMVIQVGIDGLRLQAERSGLPGDRRPPQRRQATGPVKGEGGGTGAEAAAVDLPPDAPAEDPIIDDFGQYKGERMSYVAETDPDWLREYAKTARVKKRRELAQAWLDHFHPRLS
ncbi:MAG: recombinase RecT [Actinomycetota bacterium]